MRMFMCLSVGFVESGVTPKTLNLQTVVLYAST
jgi:hypothetical protein